MIKMKGKIPKFILAFAIVIGIFGLAWVIFNTLSTVDSFTIKENEVKVIYSQNIFYDNIIGEDNFYNTSTKSLNNKINDSFPTLGKIHFSHMPLVYNISYKCGYEQTKKIKEAFSYIENASENSVTFKENEGDEKVDLYFSCESKPSQITSRQWEHLGEATYYLNEENSLIIDHVNIVFYPSLRSCGYFPFVEVHEILHAFGYEHNDNPYSIMYYSAENCLKWYENEDIYGKVRVDDDKAIELKYDYLTEK